METIFIHDLMAYEGLKIYQKADVFRFSLDSLLLANFVKFKLRDKKLLELGSGSGAVLLYLSLKTKIKLYGVEIQEEASTLAKKSVEYNGLSSQIEIVHRDMKTVHQIYAPSSFDLVIANPPFFKLEKEGFLNEIENLSIARHEVKINFLEILQVAKKMLKTNGSFYFIHRSARLEEIFTNLAQEGFVVKTIRFVYTKPKNNSLMVLIEAKYNGKTGDLQVLEPLYIHDEKGKYTKETLDIFYYGEVK